MVVDRDARSTGHFIRRRAGASVLWQAGFFGELCPDTEIGAHVAHRLYHLHPGAGRDTAQCTRPGHAHCPLPAQSAVRAAIDEKYYACIRRSGGTAGLSRLLLWMCFIAGGTALFPRCAIL